MGDQPGSVFDRAKKALLEDEALRKCLRELDDERKRKDHEQRG